MTNLKKIGSVYTSKDTESVISACVGSSEPVLLVGETGTGKTSLIREFAKKKKVELTRVSLNGATGIEEIIGKWLAKDGQTVWQDGVLISAMKKGQWIVFDEINAALPEVLFSIHSLLDDDKKVTLVEKNNEVVRPSKGFRFFATMNPPEDYAGTKDINRALLSRFNAVVYVDSLPPSSEASVLVEETGVEEQVADKLVHLGVELRQKKKDGEIFYFCSTRDLVQAARLIASGDVEMGVAVQSAIVNKMSKAEYEEVKKKIEECVSMPPSSVVSYQDMEKRITELEGENQQLSKSNNDLQKNLNKLTGNIVEKLTRELNALGTAKL